MGNLCASLEETRAKAVAKLEQIPVGVYLGYIHATEVSFANHSFETLPEAPLA